MRQVPFYPSLVVLIKVISLYFKYNNCPSSVIFVLEKQDTWVAGTRLFWSSNDSRVRGQYFQNEIKKLAMLESRDRCSWSHDHDQRPTRLVFVIPFFCPIFFSPMHRSLTSLLFITKTAGWCAASLPPSFSLPLSLSLSLPDPLTKNQLLDWEAPTRDFKDIDQSGHKLRGRNQ